MTAENALKPELDTFAAARAAGLEKAVRQFPDDVVAAAQGAVQARDALISPDDITAEPWPPMRMRGVTCTG